MCTLLIRLPVFSPEDEEELRRAIDTCIGRLSLDETMPNVLKEELFDPSGGLGMTFDPQRDQRHTNDGYDDHPDVDYDDDEY